MEKKQEDGYCVTCSSVQRIIWYVGVLELHCTEARRPPVRSGPLGKSRRRSDRPGWLDTIRYVWHAPVDDPGSLGPTHRPSLLRRRLASKCGVGVQLQVYPESTSQQSCSYSLMSMSDRQSRSMYVTPRYCHLTW